jgi:hypothetical protein
MNDRCKNGTPLASDEMRELRADGSPSFLAAANERENSDH